MLLSLITFSINKSFLLIAFAQCTHFYHSHVHKPTFFRYVGHAAFKVSVSAEGNITYFTL